MRQYLVIDLDYNEVRGVFATPQQAETYVDTFDERKFRSKGFLITPIVIEDGKIIPQEPKDLGEDDGEVYPKLLKGWGLTEQTPEDDLAGIKPYLEPINFESADAYDDDRYGIKDELKELK